MEVRISLSTFQTSVGCFTGKGGGATTCRDRSRFSPRSPDIGPAVLVRNAARRHIRQVLFVPFDDVVEYGLEAFGDVLMVAIPRGVLSNRDPILFKFLLSEIRQNASTARVSSASNSVTQNIVKTVRARCGNVVGCFPRTF